VLRGESNRRRLPEPVVFYICIYKKKREREEGGRTTSTSSDTLSLKDHSATDRKDVPLDFTTSSRLPAPLLGRGVSFSLYTSTTLLPQGFPSISLFFFLLLH